MKALLTWPFFLVHLFWTSLSMALGQIWSNKTRSCLTTLGIVVGVASVTAVIAALTGLENSVLKEFDSLGTNKIFIIAGYRGETPRHVAWERIRFRPEQFNGLLQHCPSVERLSRVSYTQVSASHADRNLESVQLVCAEPEWFAIDNRSLLQGRPFAMLDNDNARPVCLVNPKAQEDLHLKRDPVGESILLDGQRYLVIGVLEPRVEGSMFSEGGSGAEIWIPFHTAWRRGQIEGMMAVATSRSPELSEEAQAEVRFFLRRARRLSVTESDNFFLEVVEQYLKSFRTVAAVVTTITACVVAISLVVGGIGIMNIMLASVSERTREIGLRMAVGARPSVILLQFLVEAVTLAALGGLVGLLAGQFLAWTMSLIPHAHLEHAEIPLWAVGLSFAFSGSVGVAFGIFPAIKAARLDPIEALRHE